MNATIESDETAHTLLKRLHPKFAEAIEELFADVGDAEEADFTQALIWKATAYIVKDIYGEKEEQ